MERQNNRELPEKRVSNRRKEEPSGSGRNMDLRRDSVNRNERQEDLSRMSGLDRHRLNDLYERSSI